MGALLRRVCGGGLSGAMTCDAAVVRWAGKIFLFFAEIWRLKLSVKLLRQILFCLCNIHACNWWTINKMMMMMMMMGHEAKRKKIICLGTGFSYRIDHSPNLFQIVGNRSLVGNRDNNCTLELLIPSVTVHVPSPMPRALCLGWETKGWNTVFTHCARLQFQCILFNKGHTNEQNNSGSAQKVAAGMYLFKHMQVYAIVCAADFSSRIVQLLRPPLNVLE